MGVAIKKIGNISFFDLTNNKSKPKYLFLLITVLFILLPLRSVFQDAGRRWLYIFTSSFMLSISFTPLMRLIAIRIGAFDSPNERKVHLSSTPLFGGIAIYIAFIGSLLANFIFTQDLFPIVVGGTIIIFVGIIDDAKGVSAKIRLLAQLIASGIVIYFGVSLKILSDQDVTGRILNISITVFWIIGITNAFNFFDGMDGLATGVSAIIAIFLGIVAFQTGQVTLGWLSIAIVGACCGFLPFNFHPKRAASIFLGDAGSTFLGFVLACLAVKGTWARDNLLLSTTPPLLIFSVLIFDMIYITIFRIRSGKVKTIKEWIDYVGKDHLHHRLEALFQSKRYSVLFIYLITICLSLTAIVLKDATPVNAVYLLIQGFLMVIIISILERLGRKRERRKT